MFHMLLRSLIFTHYFLFFVSESINFNHRLFILLTVSDNLHSNHAFFLTVMTFKEDKTEQILSSNYTLFMSSSIFLLGAFSTWLN